MSGVDITYDGHWVLTTSDFFLTIAPTQFKVRTSADKPSLQSTPLWSRRLNLWGTWVRQRS